MAKVDMGPVVAAASGRVGPAVFYRTRFGQVVASRENQKVHTSAAAMETKTRFRRSQVTFARMGVNYQAQWEEAARTRATTAAGVHNRAYLTALRDGWSEPTPGDPRRGRILVSSIADTGADVEIDYEVLPGTLSTPFPVATFRTYDDDPAILPPSILGLPSPLVLPKATYAPPYVGYLSDGIPLIADSAYPVPVTIIAVVA